jgi:hypothetical protein
MSSIQPNGSSPSNIHPHSLYKNNTTTMLPRSFTAFRQQILRPTSWSNFPENPQIRRAATKSQATAPQTRIQRLESRLPAFLRRYTTPLRTAPVSHISAFLLLHEITAIIPLFGFAAAFHYFDWLPPFIAEGALAKAGVEKFGRYLRKKGWIEDEDVEGAIEVAAGDRAVGEDAKKGRLGKGASKWWGRGEGGVRLAVEFATAYALTKFLLPVRLVFSVWATPGFARWTVVPVVGRVGRLFGKNGVSKSVVGRGVASPAAGTNAVGGGVLPKVK